MSAPEPSAPLLRRLPQASRSKLRSGLAIVSPAHAVEELVQNALDSDAHHVEVRVDLGCFKIRVFDDGCGISPSDLGLIGDRYRTSKCHSLCHLDRGWSTYGYRGEALASLRDLAGMLQIVSKRGDGPTMVVHFVKGRRKEVETHFRPQSQHGTTVSIMDFFRSVPVRKKAISLTCDLEEIRRSMLGSALSNHQVEFVLKDERTNQTLFESKPTLSVKEKFIHIFGQEWSSSLVELSLGSSPPFGNTKALKMDGLIGTDGDINKSRQYLFVNGRLIRKSPLHKIIEQVFQKSIMTRPNLATKVTSKGMKDSPVKSSLTRHGVFCLFLTCPKDSFDIAFEPQKTMIEFKDWESVQDFLTRGLMGFFRDNFLMPPDQLQGPEASPTKNGRDTLDLDISGIDYLESPIKALDREENHESNEEWKIDPDLSEDCDEDMEEECGTSVRDAPERTRMYSISCLEHPDARRSVAIKRQCDKFNIKKISTLAQKRKIPRSSPPLVQDLEEGPFPMNSRILPQGKTPFLTRKRKKVCTKAGSALDEFMESKWAHEDERITSLQSPANDLQQLIDSWRNPQFSFHKGVMSLPKQFRLDQIGKSFRFEKSMFKSLNVLGQVDKKFIAGTILGENGSMKLVLFDQHAVHERIRLETLLEADYPQRRYVTSEDLHEPLNVSISQDDARWLHPLQLQICKFGLSANITPDDSGLIQVDRVPKCFLRREANELRNHRPSTLKDLVRTLLKDIASTGLTAPGSLNILPKTIHNVLCSQACRSAIKFGDELDLKRCEEMLKELQQCQAPFQCAHGRPSFALLLDITELGQLLLVPKKLNLIQLLAGMFQSETFDL